MEALVRWIHPKRGLVPPQEFIPLAESTGLIQPLGRLVIDKACAQLAEWRRRGLPLVPISINVSPSQFACGDIHCHLAEQIEETGIPAELLEVEITESAMMGDQAQIIAEIYKQRKFELLFTGNRWEDTRRLGLVSATSPFAKRCWLLYPNSERATNANVPANPADPPAALSTCGV